MVTLSPVTTPTINVTQNREQPSTTVRDDTAARERLQSTQPTGASLAKAENSTQKNYRQSQDFADARLPDPSASQGNRRGSLLDLTV